MHSLKGILITILVALCCSVSIGYQDILVPFWQKVDGNILWGYVAPMGNVRIRPTFQRCDIFSEGFAPVMIDNKWGYIDMNGAMVVAAIYSDAGRFSEGRAAVRKEPSLQEKRYPFAASGQLYGYIDSNGKVAIDFNFERAGAFSEGLAFVEMQTTGGYIGRQGELVIETDVLGGEFSNGLAPVYGSVIYTNPKRRIVGGSENCYIDSSGVRVFKNEYSMVTSFRRGRALVGKSFTNQEGNVHTRYGLIDVKGRLHKGWDEQPKISDWLTGVPASFLYENCTCISIPLKDEESIPVKWDAVLAMCEEMFGTPATWFHNGVKSWRTAKVYDSTGVHRADYRVGLHVWVSSNMVSFRTEAEYIDEKGSIYEGQDSEVLKQVNKRLASVLKGADTGSGAASISPQE